MQLLFVYNADSDFTSSVKDMARKFLAPDAYQCNLCKITYPRLAMDSAWKKFIATLPHRVEFLHRDEFRRQYPEEKYVALPAVFVADASVPQLIISNEEIDKAKDVRELISIVNRFLPAMS